jgi:hypothetical protein
VKPLLVLGLTACAASPVLPAGERAPTMPELLAQVGWYPADVVAIRCEEDGRWAAAQLDLFKSSDCPRIEARDVRVTCSARRPDNATFAVAYGTFAPACFRLRPGTVHVDPSFVVWMQDHGDSHAKLDDFVHARSPLADDPTWRARLRLIPARGGGWIFASGQNAWPMAGVPTLTTLDWRRRADDSWISVGEFDSTARAGEAAEAQAQRAAWERGIIATVDVEGRFVVASRRPGDHWPLPPEPSPSEPADGTVDPQIMALAGELPADARFIACGPPRGAISEVDPACTAIPAVRTAACRLSDAHDRYASIEWGSFDPRALRACIDSNPAVLVREEGGVLLLQSRTDPQQITRVIIEPSGRYLASSSEQNGQPGASLDWLRAPPARLGDSPAARRVLARVQGPRWIITFGDVCGAELGVPSVSSSFDASGGLLEFASESDAFRALAARQRQDPSRHPATVRGVFLVTPP